jgi:hypothetical protein
LAWQISWIRDKRTEARRNGEEGEKGEKGEEDKEGEKDKEGEEDKESEESEVEEDKEELSRNKLQRTYKAILVLR